MLVKSVMTRPAVTITEETSLRQVRDLMRVFRVAHVPVLRGRELVGVVTAALMRAAAVPVAAGAGGAEAAAPWDGSAPASDVARIVTVSSEMPAEHALHAAGRPRRAPARASRGGGRRGDRGMVAPPSFARRSTAPRSTPGRASPTSCRARLAPADRSALDSAVGSRASITRAHDAPRVAGSLAPPGRGRHPVRGGRPDRRRRGGAWPSTGSWRCHPSARDERAGGGRRPGARSCAPPRGTRGPGRPRRAPIGGRRRAGRLATVTYVIDQALCRVHVVRGDDQTGS